MMRSKPIAASTHNETLQVLEYLSPARRLTYAVWGTLIGTSVTPGLALLVRELLHGNSAAWAVFVATQRGRLAAWATWRRHRRRTPQLLAGKPMTGPAS